MPLAAKRKKEIPAGQLIIRWAASPICPARDEFHCFWGSRLFSPSLLPPPYHSILTESRRKGRDAPVRPSKRFLSDRHTPPAKRSEFERSSCHRGYILCTGNCYHPSVIAFPISPIGFTFTRATDTLFFYSRIELEIRAFGL